MTRIAILGGTGPEGLGLAYRLAHLGEKVAIGSRSRERAQKAAERVAAAVSNAEVTGDLNASVIEDADLVAVCVPYQGIEAVVGANAAALAGKIVIDVVNPLELRDGVFRHVSVVGGSAGVMIQECAPKARVVSAFKTISAEKLGHLESPLEGDLLLCGDDAGAKEEVSELVRRIPNLRPLDAGPLTNSAVVEAITGLLLNLNRRYKATTAVRIVGI